MKEPKHQALIATLEQALVEVSPEDCPSLIGELERLKSSLLVRMIHPSADGRATVSTLEDRLLAVGEAAEKLGTTKDYLYRHADKLPFTIKIGPRQLRFSLAGIERYIRIRQGR